MHRFHCALAALALGGATSAQTYPPATWSYGPRGPVLPAERVPPTAWNRASAADGALFQVVDALPHHDDFWSNMLAGDADHDGRQEFVIRQIPVGGGPAEIQFHEDDGTGDFQLVHAMAWASGGLLAMDDVDLDGLTDLFLERALGTCDHEFVRYEASGPGGFPDHEVWSAEKQGNVVDFRAWIADVDADGKRELVTSDNDFTCAATTLKVFEAAPLDQMALVASLPASSDLGNPVVADFDGDGRREIAVAESLGSQILVFEATGDDAFQLTSQTSHPLFNAYQLALIDRASPDGRPMLFLAGQLGSLDYRVHVYEALAADSLALVSSAQAPSQCGASIPQIHAGDLIGTRVPEIVVDRLCDPVPVFQVLQGGSLVIADAPVVAQSLEVVVLRRIGSQPGAIAIGTFPSVANPAGNTLVLRAQ